MAVEHLRQGIHLRGYAQKDPIQEYRRESFELFEEMLMAIREEVISLLCRVQIEDQAEVDQIERAQRQSLL